MKDIGVINLFKARSKAVEKKNRKLFLSTQIGEIRNSSAEGYLSTDKLKTEILDISSQDDHNLTKTVVVKESYFVKEKQSHQGVLIYYLVNTVKGWKIYNIVW